MKKFHKFLHGQEFLSQTDHCPLLSIYGSKTGVPTHTPNRLQRWGTILLNYDYKMEFLPSKKLSHADGLSRLILKFSKPLENPVIVAIRAKKEIKNILHNTVRELPITLEEIRRKLRNDNFMFK